MHRKAWHDNIISTREQVPAEDINGPWKVNLTMTLREPSMPTLRKLGTSVVSNALHASDSRWWRWWAWLESTFVGISICHIFDLSHPRGRKRWVLCLLHWFQFLYDFHSCWWPLTCKSFMIVVRSFSLRACLDRSSLYDIRGAYTYVFPTHSQERIDAY